MTRGKGNKVLSISEREALASEKKDLELELKQAENPQFGRGTAAEMLDKGAMKRQISKLDAAIEQGSPSKVAGAKKDAMMKEAKELEARIKIGMPTRFEMDNPAKCPGAIRKHMNWDKRTTADRDRYRQIMRTLEPDDPTGVDVEKFRIDK